MPTYSTDIKFLDERHTTAIAHLSEGRLQQALECMATLVQATDETAFRLEYENIRSSYEAMLGYLATAPQPDENRHNIRREFICRAYQLASRIWHTLRTQKNDFFNLTRRELEQKTEHHTGETFETLWTAPLWPSDVTAHQLLSQIAAEPSEAEQCLLISGLTISLFETFDINKLTVLCNVYTTSPSSELGLRAFCGAILAINHNRGIIAQNPAAQEIISTQLLATPQSHADLFTLQLQMFHCRDTKAVTQRMNKEIIPDLIRQSSKMGSFSEHLNNPSDMGDLTSLLDSELTSNPEWKEQRRKLSDHISWIHQQQREGADIYHATFATSKNYSFFTRMANWLRPFDAKNSDIAEVTLDKHGKPNSFVKTLINGNMFCSSDAYSFCLMLSTMPKNMTSSMLTQMGSMNEAMEQAAGDLTDNTSHRRSVISHYMQDIYRLRTLAPQREALPDLFGAEVCFTFCPQLAAPLSFGTDAENNLSALANYLMDNNHYDDALHFLELAGKTTTTYECMALCHHKLGHTADAIHICTLAGNPAESRWRTDMISRCQAMLTKYDEAIATIRAFEGWDNDTSFLSRVARLLAQNKKYAEALQLYFKLDYITEGRLPQVQRGLAWCALAISDYATAKRYYEKLLNATPTQNDLLNAAHTHLLLSDTPAAISLYRRVASMATSETTQLQSLVEADMDFLTSKGVAPADIQIIVDASII